MKPEIKSWLVLIGILFTLSGSVLGGWFFIEKRIDDKVADAVEIQEYRSRLRLEAHARIINDANELISQLCDSLNNDHDTRCQVKLNIGEVE